MKFLPNTKATLIVLIVCVLSGLVSGEMFILDFLSWSPFSNFGWGMQFAPGTVFGLAFSIISVCIYSWDRYQGLIQSIRYIFLMMAASTVIYFLAFQIAMRIAFLSDIDNFILVAGGVAGLFGAGSLSIVTKVLSGIRINYHDGILITIIGGIMGVIFFLWFGTSMETVNWPLRFAIWQVAVGWSLNRGIQRGMLIPNSVL